MSALVAPSRDALAAALFGLLAWEPVTDESLESRSERVAEALLVSGVVRAADELVADEALMERVRLARGDAVLAFRQRHGFEKPWSVTRGTVAALAVALSGGAA